ncbi:MAG: hypothetical protein DI529_00940 [Chryseobacterium sp.]|nr:MAG: hypothetical protein DI529_00940 [Chryseobacterium sp.]
MKLFLKSHILSGFSIDYNSHTSKYAQIKEGMKLSDAREILGIPDESKYFNDDIMDVYYYFPTAEARFFYSKKDSLLNRSWRTDWD